MIVIGVLPLDLGTSRDEVCVCVEGIGVGELFAGEGAGARASATSFVVAEVELCGSDGMLT